MSAWTVEQWGEKEFLNSEDEWSELLSRSGADRLFLSWRWLISWWNTWSEQAELVIYGLHFPTPRTYSRLNWRKSPNTSKLTRPTVDRNRQAAGSARTGVDS